MGDAVGDPSNKADLKDGVKLQGAHGRKKFALICSVQLELCFPEMSILETFLSITFTSNEGKAGSTTNKLKCASRTDQLSLVHPACYQNQCTSWLKSTICKTKLELYPKYKSLSLSALEMKRLKIRL